MIRRVLYLAIFAAAVPNCAAVAATPADVLLAGSIAREYLDGGTSSWCLFESTSSTYLRKSSPNVRLVSFPDVTINTPTQNSDTPTVYTVGGLARLNFTPGNPAAGQVNFVAPVAGYPAGVNAPSFDQYKETYDAANSVAKVSFTIHFPSCTLSVSATYRN